MLVVWPYDDREPGGLSSFRVSRSTVGPPTENSPLYDEEVDGDKNCSIKVRAGRARLQKAMVTAQHAAREGRAPPSASAAALAAARCAEQLLSGCAPYRIREVGCFAASELPNPRRIESDPFGFLRSCVEPCMQHIDPTQRDKSADGGVDTFRDNRRSWHGRQGSKIRDTGADSADVVEVLRN
jgi:hypothetical protein